MKWLPISKRRHKINITYNSHCFKKLFRLKIGLWNVKSNAVLSLVIKVEKENAFYHSIHGLSTKNPIIVSRKSQAIFFLKSYSRTNIFTVYYGIYLKSHIYFSDKSYKEKQWHNNGIVQCVQHCCELFVLVKVVNEERFMKWKIGLCCRGGV